MAENLPEVWLRGPVRGVPPLLQPVAHAILQAAEEIQRIMAGFPQQLLWKRAAGLASPGFHLLHIIGVLDRLYTYARGEKLSEGQLLYLKKESEEQAYTVETLTEYTIHHIELTVERLKTFSGQDLTAHRAVGRKGLPSTVQGLLFHAAEHTMRHLGQLLVTTAVLKEQFNSNNV